jgi:hypothetical protein
VLIKSTQRDLQKCIIWLKKSGKGGQEWGEACVNSGLSLEI